VVAFAHCFDSDLGLLATLSKRSTFCSIHCLADSRLGFSSLAVRGFRFLTNVSL
jgi:hypothetical protein